jgi:putative ABC transport system permease protein
MPLLRMMLSEVRHRWLSFVLGVLAVTAAVALFIALVTLGRASNEEAKRLMRNLGFNLMILPAGTDLSRYWATDFIQGDLPEEYVTRLSKTPGISADHFVATLEKPLQWRGREVLLTGLAKELPAYGAPKKAPMGFNIKPGTALVGAALARAEGLQTGDTVEVEGRKLKIEQVLSEDGSKQDVRLYVNLKDAQQMLKMPGRINAIQALTCLCRWETIADLRRQVGQLLPDVYLAESSTIAAARTQTRRMVEDHVGTIMGTALGACALWVGLLALLNVRERRQEIGVLRAVGYGGGRILVLFLGRCVLMGLLGAALGFLLGTVLALQQGPEIFKLTFKNAHPAYDLLGPALLTAPLVAAVAGLLPATAAATQDPAVVLLEQ